jgi:hypothetical protein
MMNNMFISEFSDFPNYNAPNISWNFNPLAYSAQNINPSFNFLDYSAQNISTGFNTLNYNFKNLNTLNIFTTQPTTYLNNSFSWFNTSRKSNSNLGFGQNITRIAKSYIGYKESDGSYKLFTNGRAEAWCADFVTHVVKETARENGITLPSGFGSASVSGLREWGIKNNRYLLTSNKSNKSSIIQNNVKPGDIAIFKENGRSHTGIVDKIENGKIYTIEGNSGGKVAQRSYPINHKSLSGFVQIA